MSAVYVSAVAAHLRDAPIFFEHFHVTKLFGEKLTQVRRDLSREATDPLEKKVLKGTRWLLGKNPANLNPVGNERKRLEEALSLTWLWLRPNACRRTFGSCGICVTKPVPRPTLTTGFHELQPQARMRKDFATTPRSVLGVIPSLWESNRAGRQHSRPIGKATGISLLDLLLLNGIGVPAAKFAGNSVFCGHSAQIGNCHGTEVRYEKTLGFAPDVPSNAVGPQRTLVVPCPVLRKTGHGYYGPLGRLNHVDYRDLGRVPGKHVSTSGTSLALEKTRLKKPCENLFQVPL